MRKILYIIGLSVGVASCTTQKTVKKTSTNTQKPVTTTKPTPPTTPPPVTTSKLTSVDGYDFFTQNIGDAAKNDNTISYGSIVSAKPRGYKVVKTYFPSVAQNYRQRFLILHYTALDDDRSVSVLTEQSVSSHYLVNDLGDKDIYQLVDENKRAYHAGVSAWRNDKNLNDNSIGIEIVNAGYTTDASGERVFAPFSEDQFKKVAALVKDIVDRYMIPPTKVLGHSDIAPTRKQDPGPNFPWKRLYDEYGVGMWYDAATVQNFMSQAYSKDFNAGSFIYQFQSDLQKFGYETPISGIWDKDTQKIIQAFQYHFRPQRADGVADPETWAILQALIQKYPN